MFRFLSAVLNMEYENQKKQISHTWKSAWSQKFLTVVNNEGLARAYASANAKVVLGAHEGRSVTVSMGGR